MFLFLQQTNSHTFHLFRFYLLIYIPACVDVYRPANLEIHLPTHPPVNICINLLYTPLSSYLYIHLHSTPPTCIHFHLNSLNNHIRFISTSCTGLYQCTNIQLFQHVSADSCSHHQGPHTKVIYIDKNITLAKVKEKCTFRSKLQDFIKQ
jgi:hypothetical protein